jgi:hypothetical protein
MSDISDPSWFKKAFLSVFPEDADAIALMEQDSKAGKPTDVAGCLIRAWQGEKPIQTEPDDEDVRLA